MACVATVLRMNYSNLRVVVVDNNSTIGSDVRLRERWTESEVIHSPANLGFAGGANLGIERSLACGADYIFTLNNDTIVDRECLSELVVAAEQNPKVGIVGPKIYYLDIPNRIWFAGANRNKLTFSLMRFEKGKPDGPEFDQPREVNYLCAGAMLVRREVFERVGLFDPGYFMYYEDCDFCIRVNAQGYLMYYIPTARVWHKVAASTGGEGSPSEIYYRTSSVFRFLRQHVHGLHKAGLIAIRVGYVVLKMVHQWLSGHPEITVSLWWGLRDGLVNTIGRSQSDSIL